MSAKRIYCEKCSYTGQPEEKQVALKGYGNKLVKSCPKCGDIIEIVDHVPNPDEKQINTQAQF